MLRLLLASLTWNGARAMRTLSTWDGAQDDGIEVGKFVSFIPMSQMQPSFAIRQPRAKRIMIMGRPESPLGRA